MSNLFRKLIRTSQSDSPDRKSEDNDIPIMNEYTLERLCASPLFESNPRSEDDAEINAQARDFLREKALDEAEKIALAGLLSCERKDRLCEVVGDVCLEKGDISAIGWYMQACLINSPSWEPYLLVAYAARALKMEDIYWRCLNACDAIKIGLRIPQMEFKIILLMRNTTQARMQVALRSFERAIDPYLPFPDEFPTDEMERSIFLRQNVSGDPTKPPDKQWIRLMNRNKSDG